MPPRKTKPSTSTPRRRSGNLPAPLTSHNHKDKRANIPTEELRDFIADEEKAPKTVLYPRDPSLDPQLVWRGKDEQDAQDLAVPAVPIYIQEHIKPQNIIELVRSEAKKDEPQQPMLFGDFNGLTFEDRVDFYHHEQHWSNRMILGDSLMVMTSLAEKEGLKGKVQMIYLDPPYGIKFGSNWQVSTRKRDVKDGKAEDTTRQPEQVKAFRDTWQLGIHSYLAYLRDRLVTARELLSESGSIFVQIGDENVHLVRLLLDEVFGSENFVSQIAFVKTSGKGAKYVDSIYDILLLYAKNVDQMKYRQIFMPRPREISDSYYDFIETQDGKIMKLQAGHGENNNRRFMSDNPSSQGETVLGSRPYVFQNKEFSPPRGRHWRVQHAGMKRLDVANRFFVAGDSLRAKTYEDDYSIVAYNNLWRDTLPSSFSGENIYVVQTATKVIERCMMMTTDPGDLVLDPACGAPRGAIKQYPKGKEAIRKDSSMPQYC